MRRALLFPAWTRPESMGLRVLDGRRPRPLAWLTGRRIAVLASDIDPDAGVAAVWLLRVGRRRGTEYVCTYERDSGGRWMDLGWAGGGADLDDVGRPAAAQRGPASLLAAKGSSWGRSYLDRLAQPDGSRPGDAGGWVAAEQYLLAAEVAALQVGKRRVPVARHGRAVVVWKAPHGSPSPLAARPLIILLGQDGTRITELRPGGRFTEAMEQQLRG